MTLNMAHNVCSIIGCSNSIKDMVKSNVLYFSLDDTCRSAKWANILKDRIGDIPLSQALICGKHFETSSFQTNSFKLKDTAFPSIFPQAVKINVPTKKKLHASSNEESQPIASADRVFILEANSFDIKHKTVTERQLSEEDTMSASENSDTDEMDDVDSSNILKEKIGKLKTLEQNLIGKYKKLEVEEIKLKQSLSLTARDIKRRQKIQKSPQVDVQLLKKCLSPAQIHHLIGKSKTKWSLDDLAMAYIISSLTSHDFYLYLRNELKYPLPSASNITRCFRRVDSKRKRKRKAVKIL